MTEQHVSVVIPTYNYGHFVCDAVESALAQTYAPIEVIVIDDGSTDDTRRRLEPYFDRIRYVYQPNAGLSAARNAGIALAKGELIAFLDSDDAFHPRKLEFQVAYLQAHADVGLVATDAFSDEPRTWRDLVHDKDAVNTIQEVTLIDVVLKSRFAPSSVLVRRQCFRAAGVFDSLLESVEDRDMWIRIAAIGRISIITLPLTWYRQTPGSMSRNAGNMEGFEQIVLERAFEMPSLRSNRWIRQKALGLAYLASARRYQSCRAYITASHRLLKSLATWPFPYSMGEGVVPLARLRLLVSMIRQALWSRTVN